MPTDDSVVAADDASVGLLGRLVLLAPTVVLARRNLLRARTRTALAVAAVVVGVVAIGGVGMAGEAFTQAQSEAFEGFGGTAEVNPVLTPQDDRSVLTDEEVARVEQIAGSARVIPLSEEFVLVETGSGTQNHQLTRLPEPETFYAGKVANGSIPDDWSRGRAAIVGSAVAEETGVSVGDRLRFAGETESVVVAAVLEPQGFAEPLAADRQIFVAPKSDSQPSQLLLQETSDSRAIEEIVVDVRETLNDRQRRVSVVENEQSFDQQTQILRLGSAFVTGVAGVSLFVAVITIANTMLMAVIEREGEIGLLRAVGYSKFAIVRLLLAESTMIGLLGVAVGVPIALGAGVAANVVFLGDPFAFTALGVAYLLVGVVAGVAASLIAGIYPAWRAANKRPVEALE